MRFNSDYFVLIRRAQHPSRIDLAEPVDASSKKPFLSINLSTSRQRNVPKFCKITAAFSAHGTAFIPSTIKISDFQDVKLHTAAGVRP
jgi:hypothetical protein